MAPHTEKATAATNATPGTPRSADAADRLERYRRRSQIPIVLSAVLPLFIVPAPDHPVSIVIGVVSWLVFLADLIVHQRLVDRYLHTWRGRLDLIVVVVTAPWFLLPGFEASAWVVLLRFARVVRLVIVSSGAKVLFQRIGKVAAVAASVTLVGGLLAFYVEHPTNQEFATIGDALWWAIVTLTTVGYGDITPITPAGRVIGVLIMITGVAVLGLLAGALASFFRLEPGTDGGRPHVVTVAQPDPPAAPGSAAAGGVAPGGPAPVGLAEALAGLERLGSELDLVRTQLAALAADGHGSGGGPGEQG